MLTLSLALVTPGMAGASASMGRSRRGGVLSGKAILLWQQSGLKSSLAVPTTYCTIYITLQIFSIVEETMYFIALLETASVISVLISLGCLRHLIWVCAGGFRQPTVD